MMARLDLAAIKRDANIVPLAVRAGVKLRKAGNEWKACCPFHADRSPSFTVFDHGRRFHCFGCGAAGDVLDFVGRLSGVGLRGAAEIIGGANLPVVATPAVEHAEDDRDTVAEALAIWRCAVPIADTPAEMYLRRRAITMRLPDSLRFARLKYGKTGPTHPCLVALVASADNKAIGIQRTYLCESGGKARVPKPKLSLGRVRGGAIRLAPCAMRLTVCEGIEDGLSLQQSFGQATWVAAGASMLPSMRFPHGVGEVIVGADADGAGERAARDAASAFAARGHTCRIIRPLEPYKDFNDELRGTAQ